MNKLKYLLAASIVLTMVLGCKKQVNLALDKTVMEVAAEGESFEVNLTCNGDWSITSSPEWINILPSSGNGDAVLRMAVGANNDTKSRTGVVMVTAKNNVVTLTVTQDSRQNSIVLTPSEINCGFDGGSFEVEVTSNCDWSVNIPVHWITCSSENGTNDGTVLFTVSPSVGEINVEREANVVFIGAHVEATLHVLQSGIVAMPIQVNPDQFVFDYVGGTEIVDVSCEGRWTAMAEADWISLSANAGDGDSNLTINVTENELFEVRSSFVTFTSETGNTVVLWVRQESAPDPHFLEVSPSSFLFGKEGGEQIIIVGCDTGWEFDFDNLWLSVSPQSGTGNATVTLTAAPNIYAEPRSSFVMIKSGEMVEQIIVNQEAGDEPFMASFEPAALYPVYSGGLQHLELTSNTNWQLESSDWITLLNSTGQGNASFDIVVDRNESPEARTGYVNALHNGQVLATVNVVQEGKPDVLETDITELNVRPEGGKYNIQVTSNQSWTVNSDVDWLQFEPQSGFGNKILIISVDSMMGARPRTGHIKLSGETGINVVITVNQLP